MAKMQQNSDGLPQKRGLARDIHNLKTSGAASAAELREFVSELRGRSPQEVLGIVAQSGLAQGLIFSTLGWIVVLAIFTVGPYAWAQTFNKGEQTAKAKAAAADEAKSDEAEAAPAKEGGEAGSNDGEATDDSKKAVADKMGHNDTKDGAPGDLENELEGLLDQK